ncbi:MmgE/PrpD family protein [Aeromicrobium sp. YIM 150415]|uniref:MmgE/PrpD family protein n=1 Tax=Aeromicrobium sp. YIM 150415 TaxID=2803912 RepID=UPI001965129C|nr:MmgE/PrpD family protein [Aeromicrobium sp. YIM 150415]MBM9461982.1 MmgE/PrpD family protein [Aeromicrobium sp. YIM 150415]
MNLAEQLARYTCTLDADALPPEVVQCVKDRVVDSLACALGAYGASPVEAALRVAQEVPASEASILGTTSRTTSDLAAFVNGSLIRFLDYNDGYMAKEPGHPSDNITACLAVAEAEGASGRDLIAAIVVAYEIQMRWQEAVGLNRRGWDHVNFVLISVAAAASRLMNLSEAQTAQAINLALNGHIAMRQVRSGELSDWKGCSAANAARNAVFAARLARAGMTGPSPIFEGDMGFFRQVTGGEVRVEVDGFARQPGDDFRILASKIKPFPTNGELQTAVAAAIQLRPRVRSLEQIVAIEVDTTDIAHRITASDEEKWNPTTRETADHSLPYNVARGLLDGELTLASFDDEHIGDPRARALMSCTTVREDPALTALFPEHLANRVTLTLDDGTTLTQEVISPESNAPLRALVTSVEAKFTQMADGRLTPEAQSQVLSFVAGLEERSDFAPLFSAMVPGQC